MSEQRSATLSEVEVNEIRLLLDGLKPFDLEWAELRNLIGRMFAVLTVQEAAHARLTARVAEERAGMVVQDLRAQKAEAELTEARATIERLEKRVLELCDLHEEAHVALTAERQKGQMFYQELRRMLDRAIHRLNEQHSDIGDARVNALDDVVELAHSLALPAESLPSKETSE
jgi:hypothetical protein